MTVVVDASVVVAALVDSGIGGQWAEDVLGRDILAAPHLMPVEAANIFRRAARAGDLPAEIATLTHHDLVQQNVVLFPYEPLAGRIWQLRANLTAYDAWYVALAETLEVPLVTLDRRMARSHGPTCAFRLPPKNTSG